MLEMASGTSDGPCRPKPTHTPIRPGHVRLDRWPAGSEIRADQDSVRRQRPPRSHGQLVGLASTTDFTHWPWPRRTLEISGLGEDDGRVAEAIAVVSEVIPRRSCRTTGPGDLRCLGILPVHLDERARGPDRVHVGRIPRPFCYYRSTNGVGDPQQRFSRTRLVVHP